MNVLDAAITPRGEISEIAYQQEIIRLYESECDLMSLPAVVFSGVQRIIDCDVVSFSEIHSRTRDFRALLSVEDDPQRRVLALQAFARHMKSHPFWLSDPAFFGDRALRESDFFSDEEFLKLPMAIDVFLPSGARRMMAIVIENNGHVLRIDGHRILGRSAFSDLQRDRFQEYRSHVARAYRQAQERTLAGLTPTERLRLVFPQLTPRQLDVAALLAEGKSNDDMAAALCVGLDTIKAHVKAVYEKMGVDRRSMTAIIAHTAMPFDEVPPLWKLPAGAWSTGTRA